jgi:hypothetical protein
MQKSRMQATQSEACFSSPSFCGTNYSSALYFFVDVEPIKILLFLQDDAELITVLFFYSSLREANQNCDLFSAEVEPIITLQVRAYDLGIPSLDAEVPVNIFTQVIIQ